MAMTVEQQKALALARARQRAAMQQQPPPAASQPQPATTGGGFWNSVGDGLQSLGTGVVNGAMEVAAFPVTAQEGMQWAVGKGINAAESGIRNMVGAPPIPQQEIDRRAGIDANLGWPNNQARDMRDAGREWSDRTLHEPTTVLGDYMERIGEFAPAALMGPGGIARNLMTYGVAPAVTSETAGRMAKDTDAEPWARLAGALVGPGVAGLARRIVTPFAGAASNVRQAAVNTLRNEGVTDLTAGQTTGSNTLRYMESELGGMRAARTMEQQAEQFTQAVLRRAGITANRATPDVIDQGLTRIGQRFDDLAARNVLGVDNQLGNDLAAVQSDYHSLVGISQRAPIVDDAIDDIIISFAKNSGVMTGETYQAMRSRLDRLARGNRADPQLADALYGLRNALDDAMERTLQQVNPADLGAWQEARRQYRNMLVIERAATGAGENAAMGLISPSALKTAVTAAGRRAYARGQGDFADLTRAGESIMKPLPQSGTAPRMAVRNLGTSGGSILGAALGSQVASVPGLVVGAIAGSALPWAIGRAVLSRPGRALLGNQIIPPRGAGQGGGMQDALIRALMTAPHSYGAAQAP